MNYEKESHLLTECITYELGSVAGAKADRSMHIADHGFNGCKLARLQAIQSRNDAVLNHLKINIHGEMLLVRGNHEGWGMDRLLKRRPGRE